MVSHHVKALPAVVPLLYDCGADWSSEGGSDPTGGAIPPLGEIERATEGTCELSPEFEASIFRGRKGG